MVGDLFIDLIYYILLLNKSSEPEEEEEDDNEVPPPVPARKRQEAEQTVEQEANIAPKRRRSLPDIPTEGSSEGSSAVPETPKESSVAAAAQDTSKGKRHAKKEGKIKHVFQNL
jgi:hypothetical protein